MNQKARRTSALANLAQKRASITPVVNLNALVRVYLLDGSSKVLQMFDNSTARDVLISLRFNLDLEDSSTFALFRVIGQNIRRVELNEKVSEVLKDPTDSGQEVRILFRNWISYKYGVYDKEVFQYGLRHKLPNTALWLAYMEASFMCTTGKYYLTEDEALMLGCLKMQAESGDFNPEIHTTANLKQRVATRFPNPIRDKMRALCSPTLANSGAAEDLATRVQGVYARIAGKPKIEAQIDFLQSLRTWCPFYGSTFFDVQCQYDDNPLDAASSPPVLEMQVAVGPLALLLLTTHHDAPVIMRHPYKRIIKWIAHTDKHIFTYWVIKRHVKLSDIEEYQEKANSEGEFDARPYCDCVYLVTPQTKEIEYLIKSYVQCHQGIAPYLPGAPAELRMPEDEEEEATTTTASAAAKVSEMTVASTDTSTTGSATGSNAKAAETTAKPPVQSRKSRLGVFLSALGGYDVASSKAAAAAPTIARSTSRVGTGLDMADTEDTESTPAVGYGDDAPGVSNSLFKNMYGTSSSSSSAVGGGGGGGGRDGKRSGSDADNDASLSKIPPVVKYAASMSELKRISEENQFSDNESDAEDDSDEEGGAGGAKNGKAGKKAGSSDEEAGGDGGSSDEEEEAGKKAGFSGIPSMKAFRRASRVLFGNSPSAGGGGASKNKKVPTKDNDSEGEDDG